jgi:hypothetical protein
MNKKFLYLFLALALPGLIFVFLKKFGKNEFSIPVYFEDGIKSDSICNLSLDGVYTVHDSVFSKTGVDRRAPAKLIIVYPFIKDDLSEVTRIRDKYLGSQVDAHIFSGIPNNPESTIPTAFLNYSEFGTIVHCILQVREPWSVVLLDDQNRIRGFYDGSRRDEMDRLDMELSILLKKY